MFSQSYVFLRIYCESEIFIHIEIQKKYIVSLVYYPLETFPYLPAAWHHFLWTTSFQRTLLSLSSHPPTPQKTKNQRKTPLNLALKTNHYYSSSNLYSTFWWSGNIFSKCCRIQKKTLLSLENLQWLTRKNSFLKWTVLGRHSLWPLSHYVVSFWLQLKEK